MGADQSKNLRVENHPGRAAFVIQVAGSFTLKYYCLLKNLLEVKLRAGFSTVEGKLWPAYVHLPVPFQRTKAH